MAVISMLRDVAPVISEPGEVSLADLLDRLSAEFRELSELAESLQDLPGRLGSLDAGAIVAAQQIDGLTQRLQGLATFSGALAAAAPPGWRLDPRRAAALVTLSDLQARLVGRIPAAPVVPDDEFELF